MEGSYAHAYRHANIHAGVLVDVCVFPPRMLQSRSRRGMADGGCESEFQSGLTDRGVKCQGCGVSRVECGRRGLDRAKLKEFRHRLRRQCVSWGWRNGKGLSTCLILSLILNTPEGVWSFSPEAKAGVTSQTLGVWVLKFSWLSWTKNLRQWEGRTGLLAGGGWSLNNRVGKSFAAFLSWDLQSNNQSPAGCNPHGLL